MLRSSRDKDAPSLDIYSEDEDNTALTGRRITFVETNEASYDSSVNGGAAPGRLPVRPRYWKDTHLWPARIFSVLCSIVIVSFIAVVISFLYIVLKDLRAERITTEDGSEVRLLGFWSILVLSSVAGVLCCSFSWTLTYFDSFEPGMFPPTPLSSAKLKRMTGHSFHMGYSMAILNGIVAALTFIWYLT
ncbi:ADP-ribosylation factor-like protein 6-interacting protein 6 [Pseudorasbora parva]|uniref:ADP-ribosylation factor-like protein 6-interacting protein 6 n=1 Tax=Pseudorasbora parva TaxID=51549 RepID=UPI00351E17CC